MAIFHQKAAEPMGSSGSSSAVVVTAWGTASATPATANTQSAVVVLIQGVLTASRRGDDAQSTYGRLIRFEARTDQLDQRRAELARVAGARRGSPSCSHLRRSAMLQELSSMDRITQLQDEIQKVRLYD